MWESQACMDLLGGKQALGPERACSRGHCESGPELGSVVSWLLAPCPGAVEMVCGEVSTGTSWVSLSRETPPP